LGCNNNYNTYFYICLLFNSPSIIVNIGGF
jgi:hypothetical protein